MDPPGLQYTININTEMNYWPPSPPTSPKPSTPHLHGHGPHRHRRAHRQGNVQRPRLGRPPQHRPLRAAAPIDGVGSGMWPTGGAWLTLHLWDHYDYSGDKAFLAKAYPAMKGASEFFVDTLVEEPNTTGSSPTLALARKRAPTRVAVVAGPTMTCRFSAISSPTPSKPPKFWALTRPAHPTRSHSIQTRTEPDRQRRSITGMARRLGSPGERHPPPPRLASLRLYPSWQINRRDTPIWLPRRRSRSKSEAIRRRLGNRLAHQSLARLGDAITPTAFSTSCSAAAHLSRYVRRPPPFRSMAISEARRLLPNADAKPRRRDRILPALPKACQRVPSRACAQERFRCGYLMERRQAGERDSSLDNGHVRNAALRRRDEEIQLKPGAAANW